jgi:predicted RND superfamily exporter protein
VVLPEDGADVLVATGSKPNTSGICPTAAAGGTLAANPRSGLGFESGGFVTDIIWPFIILFTMPLALVGVVMGLVVGGFTLNVISLIGTIFLAGVVVNNAIVLVDAVNRYRRFGLDTREAVVRAGVVRLRPILMTTLTTVLGLLPLAIGFGEGAELRQPLAVVVSFGLVVSTALTLLVIPAVYAMVPSTVRTRAEEQELDAVVAQAERLAAAGPAGGPPVEGMR